MYDLTDLTVPSTLTTETSKNGPRNRRAARRFGREALGLVSHPPIDKIQQQLLKRWDELPAWKQDDNHFIETGYRPISGSIKISFQSWGYLHNESVNIYTHLIGSILFAILPIYIFRTEIPPRYKVATNADLLVCSIWFIGIATCFCLSTTYHTISNHSKQIDILGAQLDYLGIILLMWGATIPLIYYGFYCDKTLQLIYWSLLSAFATACAIITIHPHFSNPFLRPVRAATFSSLAFSSLIPMLHGVFKYGWALQSQRMGLRWCLLCLGLDALGAAAYAIKVFTFIFLGFPERWFRKTFDVWGASHQWLHVMVVLAGLAHSVGVLSAFDFLHANPNECLVL